MKLPAPLSPGKIVCVGLNYLDHAEESGQPVPTSPVLFAKLPSSVIGQLRQRWSTPAATGR